MVDFLTLEEGCGMHFMLTARVSFTICHPDRGLLVRPRDLRFSAVAGSPRRFSPHAQHLSQRPCSIPASTFAFICFSSALQL
jgi:hypothetical protein